MKVRKYGSVKDELNIALLRIDSAFTVVEDDEFDEISLVYARVEYKHKFSQIYIAANERLYLPDFWRDGVCLAQGQTPDINELARAIDYWLSNEVSTHEFAKHFLMVSPGEKAKVFDEGREVEDAWKSYLEDESYIELRDFVKIAMQDDIVGKLFPYTSLMRLCFSRCTGYPYSNDTPIVIGKKSKLGKQHFEVQFPQNIVVGSGNAEEALLILKKHLPDNIGPAVKGTMDDFEDDQV